ncbi:PTS sugar transporter subunit IIC [Gottfriedia luciferensis]|uniref:PTS sugar transporter subunit IIC n=1 Tax=Gottfriedia luciferensis TaxID=178774 RepID=UPI000B44971F|nr:PTS transporter subunit EIIC [Gottfriedia luciferensis]
MMNFVEKYIMPAAAKFGNQRHLLAIRDALIGMIAITMVGSFAVLFNNLGGAIKGYDKMMESLFGVKWNTLGLDIWWGTLAFMTVFAVVGISHKLARSYGDEGFEAMLVALASYFVLVPQSLNTVSVTLENGEKATGSTWGLVNWSYTNSTALFTGIIVAIIATEIFIRLTKVKQLVIKLPDGVPPAVSKAFAKLLPGMLTIFSIALVGLLFRLYLSDGVYFNDWLNSVLVKPLTNAADSLPFAIGIAFFIHFFWVLGLHGPNILGGITTPLFTSLGNHNIDLAAKGVSKWSDYNVMAGPFFDAFVFLGGSGATLGLIIAMVLVNRKRNKQMIALGGAPGLFQINEPILFGMPIVLNPMWIIPFIGTPIVLTITSYLSISWGLVHPVTTNIPWVTPPVLGGWLSTGGHWTGAALAAINLVISVVIYLPFVAMQERMDAKKIREAANNQSAAM